MKTRLSDETRVDLSFLLFSTVALALPFGVALVVARIVA